MGCCLSFPRQMRSNAATRRGNLRDHQAVRLAIPARMLPGLDRTVSTLAVLLLHKIHTGSHVCAR